MDNDALRDELMGAVEDFLKTQNLDLVDLIFRYEGRNLVLRLLVDMPGGGISIGDCTSLNKALSAFLEGKNILQQHYTLEVSSPGLDRPLKTKQDFSRCVNRKVRFFLREPIEGKLEYAGIITKVVDETVYVDIGIRIIEIQLSKITTGKQEMEEV
ncbi:MAG: ribosome maturation factor RimP [Candidatus Omnitrophota bacterium]